jgi:hypothetical protein
MRTEQHARAGPLRMRLSARLSGLMAFEVIDVTKDEIAAALGTEEGHFADVKATAIAPSKLT